VYELTVEKTFDSAHYLEHYNGDCARMHGHTYRVQICVAGAMLDERVGMLMDFKDMKRALNDLVNRLDHQILNDVLDFNTTAELLAKYFYDQLAPKVPPNARLKNVKLWENPTNCATYYPDPIIESSQ
jgi:6-pyruvoyltetrahydropterin/6-carboxytetrahydropterin synthase